MPIEKDGETNGYWFDNHIAKWAESGIDTTEISNYLKDRAVNGTDALIRVSTLIEDSRILLERISQPWLPRLDLSDGLFHQWVELLNNPMNYPNVKQQYDQWARKHRRWEMVLHDHRGVWEAAMMSDERDLILARCDSLENSSKPQLNLIIAMLNNPELFATIDTKLSEIEENEARQKRAVYSAIQDLAANGYDVGYISGMDLIEALEEITNRQSLHNLHEIIRLQIIDKIAGFDDGLAEKYETRRKGLINDTNAGNLNSLSEQINVVSEELNIRLAVVNNQIADWRSAGIKLESESIGPHELLEWETNMPELVKQVEVHLNLANRFTYFDNRLENVPAANQYIGYLEHSDALADVVEQLELTWKEAEVEAFSIIESYQTQGLLLDEWVGSITTDPVNFLATIRHEEEIWQHRLEYINKLLEIDVSFQGKAEVESRIALLKEVDVGVDVIEDTERLVRRLITRGARHRRMLERELIELISVGKASDDTISSTFNLAEFEQFVAQARRYGPSNDMSYTGNSIIRGEVSDRIKVKIAQELAQYSAAGWYVDELQGMFDTDPYSVAKILASIRPLMKNHDSLRKRLSAMPWNRNVSLALQIQEDMQNPLRLASINEQIPQLMISLAKQAIEDAEFSFTPWAPNPVRKTLLPIPEQTVNPSDTLGDAHEAMLEAMEFHSNDTDAVQTEISNQPNVKVLEEKIEETILVEKAATMTSVKVDNDAKYEKINSSTIEKAPQLKANQAVMTKDFSIDHLYVILEKIGLGIANKKGSSTLDQISTIRKTLAKYVGTEPRDIRIDRLLRLVLRLLPQGDSNDDRRAALIMKITNNIKRYQNWVKLRLAARHKAAQGNLILDSATLGKALMRIPGPGFKIPLVKDEKPLPTVEDIEELAMEVNALLGSMNLVSTSGVITVAG